jgi:hypothetical protein
MRSNELWDLFLNAQRCRHVQWAVNLVECASNKERSTSQAQRGWAETLQKYKKRLALPRAISFIPHFSKINLVLGTALVGTALCCFVESSLAQEALARPTTSSDNAGFDDDDADQKDDKSHRCRSRKGDNSTNAASGILTKSTESPSPAITSLTEAHEAESVEIFF